MTFLNSRKKNIPNKQRTIVPAVAKTGRKYPGISGSISISPKERKKEK